MYSTDHPGSPGAGRIGPVKAPVAPRVRILGQTATLPLEERIRGLLDRQPSGLVNVIGPAGSGKTTALRHLAAAFGTDPRLRLADDVTVQHLPAVSDGCLTLAASIHAINPRQYLTFELTPWSDEDLASYLLATHPGRCRPVIGRVLADPERSLLCGSPELCRLALDEMAADDSLADLRSAILAYIERELGDPTDFEAAEEFALSVICHGSKFEGKTIRRLDQKRSRLLRHPTVRDALGTRRLVKRIERRTAGNFLCVRLPIDLVRRTAALAVKSPSALTALVEMTSAEDPRVQASAVSLLHWTGTGWLPQSGQVPNMDRAWLSGVQWDGIHLAGAQLSGADLSGASLANADLLASTCNQTDFRGATLRNVWLRSAKLIDANLTEANLCGASADAVHFSGCDLAGTNFSGASLCGARFRNVRLVNTRFCRADLTAADFRNATVESADFTDANLTAAHLPGLELACCDFGSTRLAEADLSKSILEGICAEKMNFDCAKLDGALFTGSLLHSACFASASLRNCGLAEIDWEGADLRDADLRGSTFHLGTTRSGLVGSTIPCEGSHTGFYTDEYFDTAYKNPAEIRKANLCGADLRDAQIDGVDFYLVDLRGARYTEDQAEWFRKCGAILRTE